MTDTPGPAPRWSAFQRDILAVLSGAALKGTAIRAVLEDRYDEPISNGRLYSNLDQLVDAGVIDKHQRSARTNEYRLTEAGAAAIHAQRAWLHAETTTSIDDTDAAHDVHDAHADRGAGRSHASGRAGSLAGTRTTGTDQRSPRGDAAAPAVTGESRDEEGGVLWVPDADALSALSPSRRRVLAILVAHGGAAEQPAVRDATDWTAARTSQVVGALADAGHIRTLRVGTNHLYLAGAAPDMISDADTTRNPWASIDTEVDG